MEDKVVRIRGEALAWRPPCRCLALILLAGLNGAAQNQADEPLALILSSQGGRIIPLGDASARATEPGDLLFAGDMLRTTSGTVTFLFCPSQARIELAPNAELRIAAALDHRYAASVRATPVPFCALPKVERHPSAARLHFGNTGARDPDQAQPAEADLAAELAGLDEARRTTLVAQLVPLDRALAADPKDWPAHVARAVVLERHGLAGQAAVEYRLISREWPDSLWFRARALVHEQPRPAPAARTGPGQTYALVVGISRYQSGEITQLRYAHRDALRMEQYLRSPRGGPVPSANIRVLTDQGATAGAIRAAMETLRKHAGPRDTVVLFFAGHGKAAPGEGAYIVAYDSDPQDLRGTALSMLEIQDLIGQKMAGVSRVFAFVDVCHAGAIGALPRRNTINQEVQRLGSPDRTLFGFMASRAREVSLEGPQFGGGHGAFSFFLLDGLNGAADYGHNRRVNISNEIDYVRRGVETNTKGQQHPQEFGSFENDELLANLDLPGPDWAVTGRLAEAAPLGERSVTDAPQVRAGVPEQDFEDALSSGRLLPGTPANALAVLRTLGARLPELEYARQASRLRAALEDQGQQVLLRYLAGEAAPQTKSDFTRGAAYFDGALQLTPDSPWLEARNAFCRGRAAVFDRNYADAVRLLENSIRLDPDPAFAFNALGIAYLEQARYSEARAALQDAIRRAPYWAYAWHNMALVHTQLGEYDEAIRAYRRAIQLAPHYSYLPYNLGLMLQNLGRNKEAESNYRAAIALAPGDALAYNALGSLRASEGRAEEAERLYRQALDLDPRQLAARHNLAALLGARPERVEEAIQLWRANLEQDSGYLASRVSLARTLAARKQWPDAIAEYAAAARLKPDYIAVRLALAEIYRQTGDLDAAMAQLREALLRQPRHPLIYERMGDLDAARGRQTDAAASYRSAMGLAPDRASRKRIGGKLKRLGAV